MYGMWFLQFRMSGKTSAKQAIGSMRKIALANRRKKK